MFQQVPQIDMFMFKWQGLLVVIVIMMGAVRKSGDVIVQWHVHRMTRLGWSDGLDLKMLDRFLISNNLSQNINNCVIGNSLKKKLFSSYCDSALIKFTERLWFVFVLKLIIWERDHHS